MKAVVWHGPRQIGVDEVDDPRIEETTDAVIRVTASGLCGSDLHLWEHGEALGIGPGHILGHEPMGEVLEVGADVGHIRPGDTVVVPVNVACGHCFFCQRRLYSQCETAQALRRRTNPTATGYAHLYGGVPGAQAEYLRVPQAHFGPIPVGDSVPELAALLLCDVLPSAWQAVEYADIPPGGTVAVFGLGPIGLMCARIAGHRGAGQVIGIDTVPDRLRLAADHGAKTIDYGAIEDVVAAVHELTGGRGADSGIDAVGIDAVGIDAVGIDAVGIDAVGIDAVGIDADDSAARRAPAAGETAPDPMLALHQALRAVRRGGTVSVVGVYSAPMASFPLGELFDKQVALRWGQTNARRWTDALLEVLRAGDPLDAAGLVSTQVPLAEAADAYQRFATKQPGVVKVALRP